MPDKPKKLSDTARALLTSAATRDNHLIHLPRLPVAAARQVVRSLLNGGLAEEVPAPIDDAGYVWRTVEDGDVLMLRATMPGLARVAADERQSPESVSGGTVVEVAAQRLVTIGTNAEGAVTATAADPPGNVGLPSQASRDAPEDANRGGTTPAPARPAEATEATLTGAGPVRRAHTLRRAAQAVLHAWDRRADDSPETAEAMSGPFAALRAALATRASVSASIGAPRPPKDTKHARVVSMLSRDEGASGPQIAEAMGVGRRTPSAAFSPASPRRTSRWRCSSVSARWAQTKPVPRAVTPSTASLSGRTREATPNPGRGLSRDQASPYPDTSLARYRRDF